VGLEAYTDADDAGQLWIEDQLQEIALSWVGILGLGRVKTKCSIQI
jgi:hypothetical protein